MSSLAEGSTALKLLSVPACRPQHVVHFAGRLFNPAEPKFGSVRSDVLRRGSQIVLYPTLEVLTSGAGTRETRRDYRPGATASLATGRVTSWVFREWCDGQ